MKIYSVAHMRKGSEISNTLKMFKSYKDLKTWYLNTLRQDLEFLRGFDNWENIENILDVSSKLEIFLNDELVEISLSPSNYNLYSINEYGCFEVELQIKSIDI